MIKTFSNTLLNASELLIMADRTARLTEEARFEDELIMKFCTALKAAGEQLKSALSRDRSGEYTALIEVKDDERDTAFIGFRDFTEAMTRLGKGAVQEAAVKITGVIKKYGWSLYSLGYSAQSSQMALLLGEINQAKNGLLQAIKVLGAEHYFAEVVRTQADFEKIYQVKLTDLDKKEIPLLREAKARLARKLAFIIECMNQVEDIYPDHYRRIEEPLNQVVMEMSAQARARKTRGENAAASSTAP